MRATRPGFVLVGILLIAANLRASLTTVGPVIADVKHDLGLSSIAASALISLPVLAFAVTSPVAPAIARRLGVERSLFAALAVLAVGIVVRSLPGTQTLWGGTLLLGVAIAVLNVILPSLVKRDFPRRIGQVTGLYSASQAVFAALAAGAAVPIAGIPWAGWRLAFGIWAGLAVIAMAVFAPQLRGPGDPAISRAVSATEARASAQDASLGRNPWRTALGWQVTIYMGLQSVGYYVLVTWLATIEQDNGIPAGVAGFDQLLFNGLGIAGSLGVAWLLPRFRDQRMLAVLTPAILAGAIAGLVVAPSLSALWSCLAGISCGGSIVLALSFFGLRTNHHHQAAVLSGMGQSIGYLLAAAGPLAVGALHDATGTWTSSLALLLALQAVLMVVGFLAGRARVIG